MKKEPGEKTKTNSSTKTRTRIKSRSNVQDVITVTPGDQSDLSNAEKICDPMKANRVFDCRQAGTRLAVILKEGTTKTQARDIGQAFEALGYEIMVPSAMEDLIKELGPLAQEILRPKIHAFQQVLIVRAGKQPDLLNAGVLCGDIKGGHVLDCTMTVQPPSLSIILKANTNEQDRLAIADPFGQLGYEVKLNP